MSGILNIIGVGPGDPELLTLKAYHVLAEETDVVAYPGSTPYSGTAFQIASQSVNRLNEIDQLPLSFPMSKDPDILSNAHAVAVRQVKGRLDTGKNVSFLTLGDPSIYSTASFLLDPIRTAGYEVRIISGVPSFCAGAAKLLMPLVSGNEPVQIFPSEDYELSFPGTLILLKVGRHLAQTKQKISDCGRTAYLIENCGLPGGASIPQLTGNAGENRLFFSDDRKIEKSLADTERGR